MLPKAIVVDLDGTLALKGDRGQYDFSQCDVLDKPNEPVVKTVQLFFRNGFEVVFCSGREEKYREQSERFIERCLPGECEAFGFNLFMRPTDDFRNDAIVKKELYDQFIKVNYDVLLVLDDRDRVVQMWREVGLPCFQVAPGNF